MIRGLPDFIRFHSISLEPPPVALAFSKPLVQVICADPLIVVGQVLYRFAQDTPGGHPEPASEPTVPQLREKTIRAPETGPRGI
jgi:hypothetical protein